MADDPFLRSNDDFFMSEPISIAFSVEEDPWGAPSFNLVDDMRQPIIQSQTMMDESMVAEGMTASNVLVGVDLPEIFDTAYIRAGPVGDRVSVESLRYIMGLGGLGPRIFEQISAMVVPPGASLVTRNEFNTALALLGFAQKSMELSLMTVYQHRNGLPVPTLSNLESISIKRVNPLMTSSNSQTKRQSFDEDPWRVVSAPVTSTSPSTTTDTIYYPQQQRQPTAGGNELLKGIKTDNSAIVNTTSNVTNATDPTTALVNNEPLANNKTEGAIADKVSTQALVKASTESNQWFLDLDQITVSIAEKEGFLFTHINYWVQSNRRQTSVRRRYSDFYWFWETLLKRYPFRVIPNLPPKKISGKDQVFLEQRCQGLSRFINCIVRHPVLKNDQVVVLFLTEQTEFSAWRRAKTPSTDEEFERVNPQTEELEGFIPGNLDERVDQVKSKLPQSIEKYEKLCSIMIRSLRLKEARAIEMRKYNEALKELREVDQNCFVGTSCQACPQVLNGFDSVGTYMAQDSTIVEMEVSSSVTGVIENLKRHRDIAVSFLEMLDRKSKLASNQIPALLKRISANTAKVNQNRGVPGLEAEVERSDISIKADTEKMVYQQRRATYIQYCVASELSYLHKQQAFVALLYQNYAHEQVQYARRTVDNWKALEVLLCEMPKPEEFA